MLFLQILPFLRILGYSPLLERRSLEDWVVPKQHETADSTLWAPLQQLHITGQMTWLCDV